MSRHVALIAASLASLTACADAVPSSPVMGAARATQSASGTSPRYKLRLTYGASVVADGELQSGWFPDTGIVLNTRAPWKSLVVPGATINLVDWTHGSWNAGTCATFVTSKTINYTNWDIAGTEPTLSFAGTWFGTISTAQTTGTSVYFDGDRVVAGQTSPNAGGIHNLVTNGNQAYETKDASGKNDWFQLELRNAAMKFGSASTPDGLSNPVGVEVACANFTVLAKNITLLSGAQ